MQDARLVIEDFVRPAPVLNGRTDDYWLSGADGRLRLLRCQDCGHFLHPPSPVCPVCRSRRLAPAAVSGHGVVYSWTLNRYPWSVQLPPPYVIAEIDLTEQPGLRILSNVVGCAPQDVQIGMTVEVCFARSGELYIPLFRVPG